MVRMKLRILGNTLRLRVTKGELEQISAHGFVEDSIRFAGGARLVYRLEAGGEAFGAEYAAERIRVRVPPSAVRRWARDDEVAMRGAQPLGDGGALEILVEKDFECLKPREGEDPTDFFANPAKTAG
jgi:hypothetical protein